MLLVDTNVLIDVLEDEPEWADWSIGQLRAQSKVHPLAINPIIYAELSLAFSRVEVLDKTIENLGLTILEFSRPTLFLTAMHSCNTASGAVLPATCRRILSSARLPLCSVARY